jgi:putative ABC transport system permease protein
MTFVDQLSTAYHNLGRRRLRFVLASLGVLVGTLTIVLLVSLASGVQRQIHRQFESIGLDRLTVLPPGRFPFGGRGPFAPDASSAAGRKITPGDTTRWAAWPEVAKVTPEVSLPGSVTLEVRWKDKVQPVRTGDRTMRPGPPGMAMATPEAVAGTLELRDQGTIVLSLGVAKALGFEPNELKGLLGQTVDAVLRTSRGETQSFPLRVEGVSADTGSTLAVSVSDCVAMKCWWFNDPNMLQREGYDTVALRVRDIGQTKTLMSRLRKEGFQVQSADMFVDAATRVITIVTILLVMIGSVALVVASIGIANTMIMAVYERTREIGILKALGASGRDIRRLFMIEAGLIGLAGGLMGLLSGAGLGIILNRGITWYLHYRGTPIQGAFFVVTPFLALGITAFGTCIGVLSGLLPAHRASRLDPLEALRHE